MATVNLNNATLTVTCPGVPVTQPQADALVEAATRFVLLDDAEFAKRLATAAEDVLKRKPGTLVVSITRTANAVEHAPPHVLATIRAK